MWLVSTPPTNETPTQFLTAFCYLTYADRKSSNFVINAFVFMLICFRCRMAFIPFSLYQLSAVGLRIALKALKQKDRSEFPSGRKLEEAPTRS